MYVQFYRELFFLVKLILQISRKTYLHSERYQIIHSRALFLFQTPNPARDVIKDYIVAFYFYDYNLFGAYWSKVV